VFGMFVVYFVAGIFLVLPVNEPRRRRTLIAGEPG